MTGVQTCALPICNTVDRVLFIQVPASEAAFTKWSESGNSLQQNIDIDQTFAGNSLWFKTTIYGNNLYVTRLQTSFTGALILSR